MKRVIAFIKRHLASVIVLAVIAVIGTMATLAHQNDDGTRTFDRKAPKYSEAIEQAHCKVKASTDAAIASTLGFDAPQDKGSGCEPKDKELALAFITRPTYPVLRRLSML